MTYKINKKMILESAIPRDATGRQYSDDMPALSQMEHINRPINSVIGGTIGATIGAGVSTLAGEDASNMGLGIGMGGATGAILGNQYTPQIERAFNNIMPLVLRQKDDYPTTNK